MFHVEHLAILHWTCAFRLRRDPFCEMSRLLTSIAHAQQSRNHFSHSTRFETYRACRYQPQVPNRVMSKTAALGRIRHLPQNYPADVRPSHLRRSVPLFREEQGILVTGSHVQHHKAFAQQLLVFIQYSTVFPSDLPFCASRRSACSATALVSVASFAFASHQRNALAQLPQNRKDKFFLVADVHNLQLFHVEHYHICNAAKEESYNTTQCSAHGHKKGSNALLAIPPLIRSLPFAASEPFTPRAGGADNAHDTPRRTGKCCNAHPRKCSASHRCRK